MKKDRETLKTYFETGDYPTEAQFIDLIDSFLNIEEDDAVTGITDNGDGTYTFNLLSGGEITIEVGGASGNATGLEAIDEGNGIGWRLVGRNADDYGNIGLNAVDLSTSSSSSLTNGATGQSSAAFNQSSIASGLSSFAATAGNASGDRSVSFGGIASGKDSLSSGTGNSTGEFSTALNFQTQANGKRSFAINESSIADGESSFAGGTSSFAYQRNTFAFGRGVKAFSLGEICLGIYSSDYTPTSPTGINANDRLFNVGNGSGSSVANTKDAFTILKGGEVSIGIKNFEANTSGEKLQVNGLIKSDVTISEIDEAHPRTVTTREYVLANSSKRSYDVYTALITQVGTNHPTAFVLENTLGVSISFIRNAQGFFTLTASNSVFTGKTTISLQSCVNANDGSPSVANARTGTATSINFWTAKVDNVGTNYTDTCLTNSMLEIRVYYP